MGLYIDLGSYDTRHREALRVKPGAFLVIQVEDLSEYGEDLKGFEGRVVYLETRWADPAHVARDCGFSGGESWFLSLPEDEQDLVIADWLCNQGHYSPMHEVAGNNRRLIHRELRREARDLLANPEYLEEVLDTRVVNALGQTAREFAGGMEGIASALDRGMKEGRADAALLAKMYGLKESAPADMLPYFVGYTDGLAGRPHEEGDVAPEYTHGWNRGSLVKQGLADPPAWIS